MIGSVMIGNLVGFDVAGFIGFAQPNHVVYRVTLPSDPADERRADRYVAGAGPEPGVLGHW